MIFQQLSSCYWPFKFNFNSLNVILFNYKEERGPRYGEILPRQYSPMYVRKVRLRALPGPRCQPPGLPRRPGKLTGKQTACLATGKALPQRGNLERELRSCWRLGQRGSKVDTTTHFYHNFYLQKPSPNLIQ
jgi:hypothetical protein